MKISFILPNSGSSGGVRSTIRLANGLIDKGHKVRILVYTEEFSLNMVKPVIRNIWFKLRYSNKINWLDNFKGQIEKFKNITQCSFQKDEFVIATGIWSCNEINKLNIEGIRIIHNIRGQDPWQQELMKQAWSKDVPKIAVASYLEQTVQEVCSREVLAIIPNGIDTAEYYPSVPTGQRDGIGTIYHLSYHKDPKIVLAILRKLHEDCPEVPQRVFGVSRKPKELSRDVYTRFPNVAKARDIYSRSLVWIMASRSEGFPNPVLEAMACGCIVVATDCGGTRDIITDGENGFLVKVGDVEAIVDKVKLLLKDSQLREKMVVKACETVNKFTWEESIDKWDVTLTEILKQKVLLHKE